MADFTALKTAIQTYIKQNGNEEITGNLLQGVLISMVETMGDGAINDVIAALNAEVLARQQADGTLQNQITAEEYARQQGDNTLHGEIGDEASARGEADNALSGRITAITEAIENGYVYAGIATPSTQPVSGKVFYMAITGGTYTNFLDSQSQSLTLEQGINLLKSDGTAWSNNLLIAIDNTPTENSEYLVKSGGVYAAIKVVADKLADGYLYKGIATTSTNPSTPLTKEIYLAVSAGTYTNFLDSNAQALVVTQGINILKYNGSAWSVEQVIGIDDVPTAGSTNLVKSGGVQNELALGAVYDVSAKNPTSGPNNDGKFESLAALLSDANLNTLIPTSVRKGGMSIKFVQSSDNKYVQFRCMSQNFTTDVTQWQGVDDEPEKGSDNLIKSKAVADLTQIKEIVNINDMVLLDNSYLNGNALTIDSSQYAKLYYYSVNKDKVYHVDFNYNWGEQLSSVGFTTAIPSINGSYIPILTAMVGETDYTPQSDGYIVLLRRNAGGEANVYNYVPLTAQTIKDSIDNLNNNTDELKRQTNIIKIIPYLDMELLDNAYVNSYKQISSNNNTALYYCGVNAQKKYNVSSLMNWSDSIVAVGFSTQEPVIGGEINDIILLSNEQTDKNYVPTVDGYIILLYRKGANQKASISEVQNCQDLRNDVTADNVNLQQNVTTKVVVGIDDLSLLDNAFLNKSNHKIETSQYTKLYYYPVNHDTKYHVDFDYDWSNQLDAVGFSTEIPSIDGTYDSVLIAMIGESDYTPSVDGYIILLHRNAGGEASVYNYVITTNQQIKDYITSLENEINKLIPLKDKTVAILGDSIMQFMGGDVPTNSITLYNYDDPTDTTIYQISQATIVNGIIYLTSSLTDGQVTENSIRLDIINSAQDYIDSRGWDYIKTKLKAKTIINCAQGGGRFGEMGIVTAYPSVTLDNPFYADKLQGLPNQVRMLKRLVNNGDYSQPNIIVIWMGVNGTTNYTTDTLAEAMAIDWNTLSDDILGYTYRTKFFGAIRYAIESLYRAFPDAVIMFCSPVMTSRGNLCISSDNPAYRGFDDLKQTSIDIKSIAERYACMFCDALTQIGVANFAYRADTMQGTNEVATGVPLGNLIPRYTNPNDGIHPNAAGKIVWGNYLCRMISSFYFDKV